MADEMMSRREVLAVGAVVVEGGYMWHGARMGLEFDFGMGEGVFVFVGYDHFHEGFFRMRGREWAWHIHGDRFHDFYRRSVIRNEFHRADGKLAARVTSTGGWLDLAGRKLFVPPPGLADALRGLDRTDDFEVLETSVKP